MADRSGAAPGDDSGLICGYLFRPGEAAQELTPDALAQPLAIDAGGGFAWLHFNLAHRGAQRWLQAQAGLSEAFHQALRQDLRSTRIERDEQALVAVLNDVKFHQTLDATDIATLWLSVDRRLIVTARHSALRSVDRLRLAIRHGERIGSTVEVLERLLRAQAGVLAEIARDLTPQVDRTEDQLLRGRPQATRAGLSGQRRMLVRLQRLLAPEPASLFRLLQHPPDWMTGAETQQLREASEELSVALQDMAALQERIKLLQEELAAMVGERTGRSLFVLTVVTVLALPINILAGLFGMNVGGVPFAGNPHGFWLVAGLVLAFTAGAAWWGFRRARRD